MKPDRGIGILSAILLIGAAALIVLSIPIVDQVAAAGRALETRQQLEELKVAIAGNPNLVVEGGRADFGYIGTIGNVPGAIGDLWLKGSQNDYAFDTSVAVGAGWIGPYPADPFVEDLLAFDKDPYGNDLVYTSVAFNRPSDGAEVAGRILSRGPDGVSSTSDDLVIDILKAEIFSTVTGTLVRNNQPAAFASVTLNRPVDGAVDAVVDVTDANGVFSFTDVPYGFRSLSVDPKLTYEEGTAVIQANTRLKFTVTNFGSDAVSIDSITATYDVASAYFESIRFGNTTVFDYQTPPYNGTRGMSGQEVLFTAQSSAQNVNGSGKPSQIIPIRVEQEVTETPDLRILGVGSSVVIEIRDFKNLQTGTASNVSVSGGNFTIEFSDGSVNTFTVP